MAGVAGLALGIAPIFGGVLLASAVGQLHTPDFRGPIRQDLDILDKLPPEQAARKAELQRTIGARIDNLIAADQRRRELRQEVALHKGNARDVLLFFCILLFTFVWWHVSHQRHDWLPLFVVLIGLSVVTGSYATMAVRRGLTILRHGKGVREE
ncbi:MAG: hypothetical protein JO330_01645 [Mycobacteriaceae bacterium]|nr:hypothetical protein [Mycobacteriaceae bacterium]